MRRNSENSRVVLKRNNISNGRKWKATNETWNNTKNFEEIEDENLKLKRQIEEINGRQERLQKKWDSQMQEQKKNIQDLTTQLNESKQQFEEQKKKHQKEMIKNKSIINNLERDTRNLRRGIDNIEKEKSQLKEQFEKKLDWDSAYQTRVQNKGKDTPRSHDEYEFYSKQTPSNANSKVIFNKSNI